MTAQLISAPALGGPADIAVAHALLDRVAAGRPETVVRVYRPQPTVAFGRQDAIRPGLADAAAAARAHGFEPVIRSPGGHAAAYHPGCLVVDHLQAERDATARMHERFAAAAERYAAALRTLGVAGEVGEIAGEYCAGAYSVHAGGRVKLVGIAQRIVRGAWLLSAVVVVRDPDPIRAVLRDVYGALDLPWEPATAGAISDEAPAVTVDAVERAVLDAHAGQLDLADAPLAPDVVEDAGRLVAQHAVR